MKESMEGFVRCADCKMIESVEWAEKGNHVCDRITDPNYKVMEDMTVKVGKKRWIKIEVENSYGNRP